MPYTTKYSNDGELYICAMYEPLKVSEQDLTENSLGYILGKNMDNVNLIQKKKVMRDYGFSGVEAIVHSSKYGRFLICDGYGGENTLAGGAVRFKHGMVIRLKANDTLESLEKDLWNDSTTLYQAMFNGLDDSRPILYWYGSVIEKLAKATGLL